MFHVSSTARPKRVAKSLCEELKRVGDLDFPYAKCLDIVSRMYGYLDFKALEKAAGKHPASLDDSISSPEEVKDRRRRQSKILIAAGVKAVDVEAILDTVRPTCRSDHSNKPALGRKAVPKRLHGFIFESASQIVAENRIERRLLAHCGGIDPFSDNGNPRVEAWQDTYFGSFFASALHDGDMDCLEIAGILIDLHDAGLSFATFVAMVGAPLTEIAFLEETGNIGHRSRKEMMKACKSFMAEALYAAEPVRQAVMAAVAKFCVETHLGAALLEQCALKAKALRALQSRFLADIVELRGADLMDLAILVSCVDDSFPEIVETESPPRATGILRLIDPVRCDVVFESQVADSLRKGVVERFGPVTELVHFLSFAVKRADGEVVLCADLLATAIDGGLTLDDLADAIAHKTHAGPKVKGACKSPDADLLAVMSCLDEEPDQPVEVTIATLRELHMEGIGLGEFVGNTLVSFCHPDYGREPAQDAADAPTPIAARAEDEMVFVPTGLPEEADLGPGFDLLDVALRPKSPDELGQIANFIATLLDESQGLLDEHAFETTTTAKVADLLSVWSGQRIPKIGEVMDIIAGWDACARESKDPRRALECHAMNAGFILGVGRFFSQIGDFPVRGGLTLPEMAYLAFGELEERISASKALAKTLTVDERKVLAAARHTRELMASLVAANKSRAKQVESRRERWADTLDAGAN